MSVVDRSFDHPMKLEEHATMRLAAGILAHGYQCGMLWGAALAAGAEAYRRFGPGPQAEAAALIASGRCLESFRDYNKIKEINCLEITEMDWQTAMKPGFSMEMLKYFLSGKPIGCFRMAARYAPAAFYTIDRVYSNGVFEAPEPPVSCAALLAQKMGESELHQVMAAGLAGGIGLSGGGCGALGAALWIVAMKTADEGEGKLDYDHPRSVAAVEIYLKSAGYEFECAKVVGRKFESVADHADYLRQGGCAAILAALAAA